MWCIGMWRRTVWFGWIPEGFEWRSDFSITCRVPMYDGHTHCPLNLTNYVNYSIIQRQREPTDWVRCWWRQKKYLKFLVKPPFFIIISLNCISSKSACICTLSKHDSAICFLKEWAKIEVMPRIEINPAAVDTLHFLELVIYSFPTGIKVSSICYLSQP